MAKRDAELHFACKSKAKIRHAAEEYDEAVEEILAALSLPLSDSLRCAPEEVAAKSKEILEKLIELRQKREQIFDEEDKSFEEYVNRFPEEEREEIRAKIQGIGMFS